MATIFLAVLSIIGISAMQNTAVEQKMSLNMQDKNRSFQLAETALARVVQEVIQDTAGILNPLNPPQNFDYSSEYEIAGEHAEVDVRVTVSYLGESPMQGLTLEQVQSLSGLVLHVFEIEAIARYNQSVANHVQGISIVGPTLQ